LPGAARTPNSSTASIIFGLPKAGRITVSTVGINASMPPSPQHFAYNCQANQLRSFRNVLSAIYLQADIPEVNFDDIYVFEFLPPSIRNEHCLPSPLDKLCTLRFVMDMTEAKLQKVLEWNCQKHIVTSEQVNIPKDTTTEGISLLDDFRRYLVTGDHLGLNKRYLTMNGLRTHMSQNPSNLSSWRI
jgi:hypothetical protein